MTTNRWEPHHSMSSFLSKEECSAYNQGFYEALSVTAANELYNALERLSDVVLSLNPDANGHILNAINAADAALAKARGKENGDTP